jgi:hypothetical protein
LDELKALGVRSAQKDNVSSPGLNGERLDNGYGIVLKAVP